MTENRSGGKGRKQQATPGRRAIPLCRPARDADDLDRRWAITAIGTGFPALHGAGPKWKHGE
jgi:hypothetical protein